MSSKERLQEKRSRKSNQGKVMIVVATCYATRYVETKALPSGKAGPVAKFILENIILRHGCITTLVSDQRKAVPVRSGARTAENYGSK